MTIYASQYPARPDVKVLPHRCIGYSILVDKTFEILYARQDGKSYRTGLLQRPVNKFDCVYYGWHEVSNIPDEAEYIGVYLKVTPA